MRKRETWLSTATSRGSTQRGGTPRLRQLMICDGLAFRRRDNSANVPATLMQSSMIARFSFAFTHLC